MACQSQRGLPLCLTNDHISSISASASPARSRSQATSAGSSVRSTAVFTDSSLVSFAVAQKSPCEGNRVIMGQESPIKLGQRGQDARQEVPMRTPKQLYAQER